MLAIQVGLLVFVAALKFFSVAGGVSPDCQYYLGMGIGRRVPAPYCHRLVVPYVSWFFAFLFGVTIKWPFRIVVAVGSVASAVGVFFLSMVLGGEMWAATVATLAFLCCTPLFEDWLNMPWLTDSWAVALTLWAIIAVLTGYPVVGLVMFLLAAITKEGPYVIGAAFLLAYDWSLWPYVVWGLPLYGLVVLVMLKFRAPPDRDWLAHPLWHSMSVKRRKFFLYDYVLAGMKATPFLAVAFLPGTEFAVPALIAAGLAWAQTFVAMDTDRLLALALPFIIPCVAVVAPAWALGLWALSSLWWPRSRNVVV